MFSTAAKVAPAPSAAKKSKSKARHQIAGVEAVAMLAALASAVEAAQESMEAEVKAQAGAIFEREIAASGRRPESFDAFEGSATANVQLKKRGSNLGLSPEALALLAQHGITPHKEVSVPKLYGINPVYAENSELLGKVEGALKGIVPADFIVLQDEQYKSIVTDAVFDEAMAKKLPLPVLLSMGSLVCKPRLTETNLKRLLEYVERLMTGPAPQSAANEGAKAAA